MKSLIGFCDPITQEYIEDKINANPNVSCVEYYKKFKCPKGVIFFKKSQDWLEQHELEIGTYTMIPDMYNGNIKDFI